MYCRRFDFSRTRKIELNRARRARSPSEVTSVLSEADTEDVVFYWSKDKILIYFFIVYVTTGNLWFMLRYDWHFIDSMYTLVITFTTVGYGIEIVEHEFDQFVVIFIAILGVFIVMTGAGLLFMDVVNDYKTTQKRFLHYNEENPHDPPVFYLSEAETVVSETHEHNTCARTLIRRSVRLTESNKVKLFVWLLCVFLGGSLIGFCEGWHWFESIYFTVISGTTIGFGDYSPKTWWGRLYTIFYLPMVVGSTFYAGRAIFAWALFSLVKEDKEIMLRFKSRMAELLNDTNFNTNILLMDIDGDGKVDQKEFMLQILINQYDVPEKMIDRMRRQFNKLDDNKSGFIDQEDFQRFKAKYSSNPNEMVG